MATIDRFTHLFVEYMPNELDDGILYISLPYKTTIHLCACGCRTKVVCVLSPTDHALTFDGETISLWPSIGNWDFYCRSHYVLRQGRVFWAPAMSDVEIAEGRRRDRQAKEARAHGLSDEPTPPEFDVPERAEFESSRPDSAFGSRFATWLRSTFR